MRGGPEKSPVWRAAESAFGTVFVSFGRVAEGNSSQNYHAEAEDGRQFFVKLATARAVARAIARQGAADSPLVPRVAFSGATGELDRWRICAFEWMEGGESIPPERLSPALIEALLSGYSRLSEALARVPADSIPVPPGLDEAVKRAGEPARPIHGDFHYRNFFFRDGALFACFDLEKMRMGFPAEDLLRVFVHALERTRFWNLGKIRAIERNFAETVRRSPWPQEAWLVAIDLYEAHKAHRRAGKARFRLFLEIENFLRSPLYRKMRAIVAKCRR